MKKILAIVALSLLLTNNINAKEIYLSCENYRVIGYYKDGTISNEPADNRLNEVFKIDTKKKKVYSLNSVNNKFYEENKVKWSEASIIWSYKTKKLKNISVINRFDLSYKNSMIYNDDIKWRRIEDFAKCKERKKKL